MTKKTSFYIMILLLLATLLIAAVGCSIEPEVAVDILTSNEEESGDNGNGKTDDGDSQEPVTAEEPEPESEPPYDPFQVILDYGGFNDEQKRYILDLARMDPNADWIYSIAEMIVSEEMAETDILFHTQLLLILLAPEIEAFFGNTLFPCGEDIEGGFVVCSQNPQVIEPGPVFLTLIKLAEPVPSADPDRFYTYSVVFDADGEPSNNFEFMPPYDWDYYQNTDRWYMLDYVASAGWMLNVYDFANDLLEESTGARAVVMGDVIAFFIPASEFTVDSPGYRITTFGHDGTYAPEASCGDVSGANPTEPLLQFEGEPISLD
jgi:hypothetical protein